MCSITKKPYEETLLIDMHAHMCDDVFDQDIEDVLKRAKEAGVKYILAVGESLLDTQKTLRLAVQYPMLLPAAGLYPTILDQEQAEELKLFIRQNIDKLFAIGEVGLDYWKVKEEGDREIQRQIFSGFIELATELSLPLTIHSRSAGRQTIALLLEHNAKKVILHAFDGKASTAFPAVEAGYYFSIPPSIVHSQQKRKLVKKLPLSCLLVETDSPVLGPVPAERNEPANVMISVKEIAAIKNVSVEDVLSVTGENATHLLGEYRIA